MSNKEQIILEIFVDYEKGLKTLGEYQNQIDKIKATQASLKQEHKNNTITTDAYRKSINELNSQLGFYKDGVRQVEKELKNNLKTEKAAADSIDGMKSRLSNLTAEYNRLGKNEADVARKNAIGNQIRNITTELNAEEQSLGNFRRQVGNYEVATKSLTSQLGENTKKIAEMIMANKNYGEEYEDLLKKASAMRDAMADANQVVGVEASNTKGLDRIKDSVDLLAGSFTALNSVRGIFGKESNELEAIVQRVQIGIGALSAATAIQNGLQKQGAVIRGITIIQSKAKTAALAMETKGTIAATAAQKVFNSVAYANPYVLLAVALISVVGALVLFASKSETAAEKQERLNQKIRTMADYLDYKLDRIDKVEKANIKAAETELALAKARGESIQKIEALEDAVYKSKRARVDKMSNEARDAIKNIDANTVQMEYLQKRLFELKRDQANGWNTKYDQPIKIDGKTMYFEFEEALKICQEQIDITGKELEVGMNIKSEQDDIENSKKTADLEKQKIENEKAIANAKERKQKELQLTREMEDAVLSIVKDTQKKEIEETKLKYSRQIEDLKTKLATENNLSIKSKEAINSTISSLELSKAQELDKINKAFTTERFAKEIEEQRMFIEARLTNIKAGSLQEHQLKMQQLALSLEEELRANAEKEDRLQIDEQLIRDKYAAQREQTEKDYDKAIADKTLEKTKFRIENELIMAQMKNQNDLDAKLEAKLAEIELLTKLDEESDEAFLNRKLKLQYEEQQMIQDIAETKRQETQDMLVAVGGAFGAISGLMENMAEDNESLATFSKVLAMFEIGINTAVAIANAVKNADVPFPANIAAIAIGVATVIANITQATQLLNKQKEPKAPKMNKYASGGLVNGIGSGTSDNVPSMLSAGESVMTAYATSLFGPVLSSFNQIGGGVPIQAQNIASQIMGEDILARAFAKGAASLPAPQVAVTEINNVNARSVLIEQLRTF